MGHESVTERLLRLVLHSKGLAELTVIGSSMLPALHDGDIVTITASASYEIGDILVYCYKDEGLLIHRLLKQDTRYFCKGDNAFRLEDISPGDVIGKVISVNSVAISPWADWKIQLSYRVNRQFRRCGYDVARTMQTELYKLYSEFILRKEENSMTYQKNTAMDFIPADETSLAVFDPDSGNTYFFDETGIDILNALEESCDMDTLLQKLCEIYDTSPEEIRADVEEFLADTVQKKVVIIQ